MIPIILSWAVAFVCGGFVLFGVFALAWMLILVIRERDLVGILFFTGIWVMIILAILIGIYCTDSNGEIHLQF